MLTPISNNFTGNIDDLLNHCASVTDEQLDQALELEKAVKHVMEELEMTREEALQLIEEIHMNEIILCSSTGYILPSADNT